MSNLKTIEPLILTLRAQKVILDADWAEVYGGSAKRLNEQFKRKADRFPEDFMFQMTGSQQHRDPRALPRVLTEQGAIMEATVLNSPKAVEMSVFVVRAFVQIREPLAAHAEILHRLAAIDKTLLEHNDALQVIWEQLQPLLEPPDPPKKRRIGFNPHLGME